MKRALYIVLIVGALASLVGCKTLEDALKPLESASAGTTSTPEDGLREALRVGTARAVDQLSSQGGFLDDALVRIPLPDKLDKVGSALRKIGLGSVVDDFETSMNRAAEEAVPLAKPVFMDAIREMSFEDAMSILRGKEHEATDYFRGRTSSRLGELFQPKVARALDDVGATREFNELMGKAQQIPFVETPPVDLAGYVTDEALDGLFDKLGDEEKKIREDPVARTTDLLKRWFGRSL